jgi:hypothetical protein
MFWIVLTLSPVRRASSACSSFDPDLRQTVTDRDAADRDFAAPGGTHALQQEREAPVVVDPQPQP